MSLQVHDPEQLYMWYIGITKAVNFKKPTQIKKDQLFLKKIKATFKPFSQISLQN